MKDLHELDREIKDFLWKRHRNKRFNPNVRDISFPSTGTGGRAGNVQPVDSENLKRFPLVGRNRMD